MKDACFFLCIKHVIHGIKTNIVVYLQKQNPEFSSPGCDYIHLWLVAVSGASKFPQMNQIGGVKVDLNSDINTQRNIQTVLTLILPVFGILQRHLWLFCVLAWGFWGGGGSGKDKRDDNLRTGEKERQKGGSFLSKQSFHTPINHDEAHMRLLLLTYLPSTIHCTHTRRKRERKSVCV